MLSLPPAIDVFLQPGEIFVGDADYRIRTLLGSCVSITLWHRGRRIGAMSHFLLAERGGDAAGGLDGRYCEDAMLLMRRALEQAGVSAKDCQAKLFGGGNMFPQHTAEESLTVGRRNGEAARRMVRSQGIPIVSESLFGVGHRNIILDVRTGDVWARRAGRPKGSQK